MLFPFQIAFLDFFPRKYDAVSTVGSIILLNRAFFKNFGKNFFLITGLVMISINVLWFSVKSISPNIYIKRI
jgi:hypothetical protein